LRSASNLDPPGVAEDAAVGPVIFLLPLLRLPLVVFVVLVLALMIVERVAVVDSTLVEKILLGRLAVGMTVLAEAGTVLIVYLTQHS
jgi:hypothetical protein